MHRARISQLQIINQSLYVSLSQIGVVQVAFGTMAVLSGNPALIASGLSSIVEGIQDLAKSAAIANGELLNWRAYLTDKAIKKAVEIATLGIEQAYVAARGGSRAAINEGMKEAGKRGLSGQAASEFAREYAKEIALTQTGKKLAGTELTKAILKEVGVKAVHYGIVITNALIIVNIAMVKLRCKPLVIVKN